MLCIKGAPFGLLAQDGEKELLCFFFMQSMQKKASKKALSWQSHNYGFAISRVVRGSCFSPTPRDYFFKNCLKNFIERKKVSFFLAPAI